MRFLKWGFFIALLLTLVYLAGPYPATPEYRTEWPSLPAEPGALISDIKEKESQHTLKPDNEARILWANDSLKQPTEYAIVYLHGFSASQAEGDPVHKNIAREFGCNLYLSRLAGHGIDTVDALSGLTAEQYWESATRALAIGNRLGKKVILMATSAGGALALKLAATYPDKISGLILLSPCIAINDPAAFLLNNHWGLQLAQWVLHSKYVDSKDLRPINRQYWYTHYRVEGAAALQEFLETSMNQETFARVKQPTDLLYYYKDEIHQDSTVKVSAMLHMFDQLGTPGDLKRKKAMPEAGTHVIGSYIRSGDVQGVQQEIEKFLTGVMKLSPVH